MRTRKQQAGLDFWVFLLCFALPSLGQQFFWGISFPLQSVHFRFASWCLDTFSQVWRHCWEHNPRTVLPSQFPYPWNVSPEYLQPKAEQMSMAQDTCVILCRVYQVSSITHRLLCGTDSTEQPLNCALAELFLPWCARFARQNLSGRQELLQPLCHCAGQSGGELCRTVTVHGVCSEC